MSQGNRLFLFVWFYIGWFGTVFLAQKNISYLAWSFPLVLLGYLLRLHQRGHRIQQRDSLVQLLFLAAGIGFDYFLFEIGILRSAEGGDVFPSWLAIIWILFVVTFLPFAKKWPTSLWLAALLAAIFAPLSYYSGQQFEVLQIAMPWGPLILGFFWAFYFPLFICAFQKNKV